MLAALRAATVICDFLEYKQFHSYYHYIFYTFLWFNITEYSPSKLIINLAIKQVIETSLPVWMYGISKVMYLPQLRPNISSQKYRMF
jgi:hypothetical protein